MLKFFSRHTGFMLTGAIALALTGFFFGSAAGVAENLSATPAPALRSQTPTAAPTPMPPGQEQGMVPTPDRLARPTMPANPVQADHGSQVYYMVCMACHGDQGQGLTPEWLEAWGLDEDLSCWQSKCHASNHPEEGFKLPEYIPPVVGSVIPARFETALDLHNYIKEKMPWQAPGSLSEEEYWQLTAFLVRENGFDPGTLPLNTERAATVRLRLSPTPTPALGVERAGIWFSMIGIFGLAFSLVLVKLAWNLLTNRTR